PSATAVSVSQMNISWASGGSQDHYHVKSSSDGYASNIYNSTGTSTSQSSLASGTQYTYRIYGVDADDVESSSYASVSKYTLSDPPTSPTVTDGTYASKINVGWTSSVTADHYHVWRDGISGAGTQIYNSSETNFDDTITGSHTYYIYAVNVDDAENSSYISDTGSTDNSLPTVPTALIASAVSTTLVDLSWTASTDSGGSGLAGYKIERAPDLAGSPGTFAQIDTSGTNSYTDNSASTNTKYWYKVRAYDNAGNHSGYSGEIPELDYMEYATDGAAQTAYVSSGGALTSHSESTIKTQGSYSLKGVATTGGLNKKLTRTVGPTIDLSNKTSINFDIRASRTGSNIKIGIHDSGGTTTEITPNITSADNFQTVDWDISGIANADKDAIDQVTSELGSARHSTGDDCRSRACEDGLEDKERIVPVLGLTQNILD
ncbi:hypothetical protein LCGC14_2713720, partial [marine sediment metagenome]